MRYYTVVYEIREEGAFASALGMITDSLANETDLVPGVRVTACGIGDAMTQADALSTYLNDTDEDSDQIVRDYAEVEGLDGKLILG